MNVTRTIDLNDGYFISIHGPNFEKSVEPYWRYGWSVKDLPKVFKKAIKLIENHKASIREFNTASKELTEIIDDVQKVFKNHSSTEESY